MRAHSKINIVGYGRFSFGMRHQLAVDVVMVYNNHHPISMAYYNKYSVLSYFGSAGGAVVMAQFNPMCGAGGAATDLAGESAGCGLAVSHWLWLGWSGSALLPSLILLLGRGLPQTCPPHDDGRHTSKQAPLCKPTASLWLLRSADVTSSKARGMVGPGVQDGVEHIHTERSPRRYKEAEELGPFVQAPTIMHVSLTTRM